MMRAFGWDRIGIVATDTQFSKDLVNQFKSAWIGDHDDWSGRVAFSDTVLITSNGTVDEDSVLQVIDQIPTDPDGASRVILLVAHQEHAFPIIERASSRIHGDTIWVGSSSWTARNDLNEFSWMPEIPGYVGLSLVRNRDLEYQSFLSELKNYQRSRGKHVLDELPLFAAETVDSIRALTMAIVAAADRRNGKEVVQKLRGIAFSGVSGHVAFTAEGDRKDPLYSLFNAQHDANNSKPVWKEIGTIGTTLSSAKLTNGIESVCFAQVGCELPSAPDDTYPPPPYKLPIWAIFLIVVLTIVLVALAYNMLRNRHLHALRTSMTVELNALRDVVGMRAALCTYVPDTGGIIRSYGDVEKGIGPSGSINIAPAEGAKWMWEESPGAMHRHGNDVIFGDAKDRWILYAGEEIQHIEEAYQQGMTEYSPSDGYVINFAKAEQTNVVTRYARRVQRVLVGNDSGSRTIAMESIEVGNDFPLDLAMQREPGLVLCEKDIVEISKQRPDGWAFGTKVNDAKYLSGMMFCSNLKLLMHAFRSIKLMKQQLVNL
jgi:Receptor family ligand binding region/WWE domain